MIGQILPQDNIDGFDSIEFEYGEQRKTVFRGGCGPGIVLMHEVPCLHRNVIELAKLLVDSGFTVWMPVLFGRPGAAVTPLSIAVSMTKVCISREFKVLASRQTSPVTEWLRALARHAHRECGGEGVGVLGMCLTGGFGLAMMADSSVIAPVLANPSLPFALSSQQRCGLGIDDSLLIEVKNRAAIQRIPILGLRFSNDPAVPGERFEKLRENFHDQFIAIEIDSSPGNCHGIGRWAHSVLGVSYVDDEEHPTRIARERVLDFFRSQLLHAQISRDGDTCSA